MNKTMTPADELMALAGKWIAEAEAEGAFDLLDRGHSNGLHACAADLRALLDSDAFRAMVRDAARGRYVISRGKLPTKTTAGYHYEDGVSYTTPGEAIDAAASGAGEGA